MDIKDVLKQVIEHYEAALKEAFPRGATGDVFHHWNEARKLLEQQPVDDLIRKEFGLNPPMLFDDWGEWK